MKNKGFTLIELLAVIVILAIIALIAMPIVLNIVNESKMSTLKVSAQNYIRAVEQAIMIKNINGNYDPSICEINNKELFCDGEKFDVEIDGEKPTSGEIKLKDGKVETVLNLKFNSGYVKMENGEFVVTKTPSSGNYESKDDIKTEVKDVEHELDNSLFSKTGYYTSWTGIYEDSSAKCTDYVSLEGVKKIKYYTYLSSVGYEVAFFNSNKQFMESDSIAGRTSWDYNEVDIPTGAKYAIFSHYGTSIPKVLLIKSTEVRVYRTFSILGDSYSTFTGHLTPSSNSSYFPISGNDVTTVEQTWWKAFEKQYGAKLEVNNSYSGAAISYHGYSGDLNIEKPKSFVTRVKDLSESELIVIEGGTNDLYANAPMGEYKYSDWTESDLDNFRPAVAYVIDYIKKNYPKSTIVFMVNTDLGNDIEQSIDTICNHYGVKVFKMEGITKVDGHPDANGMSLINNQFIRFVDRMGL